MVIYLTNGWNIDNDNWASLANDLFVSLSRILEDSKVNGSGEIWKHAEKLNSSK